MSLMGGLELAPLITKIKVDIANFKKRHGKCQSGGSSSGKGCIKEA